MFIDTYLSNYPPYYCLILPAGTDLSSLQGSAGNVVAIFGPMTARLKNVSLEVVYEGDLLAHLQAQIAAEGAGLVKGGVTSSEVAGD